MSSKVISRLILIAVIVIAAFFLYRYFFVDDPNTSLPDEPRLVALGPTGDSPPLPDDEFLQLLERLQSIELDVSVFTNPIWVSLKNFRRDLISEPRGRRNPFEEVGVGNFDVTATTTSTNSNASTTPEQ